jgi:predicted ribosomally synthesized peptide with SipW-like signal peptide
MKKILISLFVIGVVAAITVGATRAYFTDQAVVDDNTFSAGALDFTLNGDMTETKSLALTDLEPGADWSGPYTMKVYNKNTPLSTVDMKYKFSSKKESESVTGFYKKLNVKVVHGFCDGSYPGEVNPTNTYEGKLKDMSWDSTADSISGGKLKPNITHCFALYFQLDSSAGNEYQGANAVADIVVDGTQYINPGWNE